MRLINTATLELEDFAHRKRPRYAILSHTWGSAQDEVTFPDMNTLDPGRPSKPGYVKIVETCRLAAERGLSYAWIDTCCIDKSSSAELTEAINSMFNYYAESQICIAHLADLAPGSADIGPCHWFTRGWTLQELLASRSLEFYDRTWKYVGTKSDFVGAITQTTRVDAVALREPSRIGEYSVATRLSWSSNRQTTRMEDMAYCLLGIFDVSMPLIYGEGDKAFQRLLGEIVHRENDPTILSSTPSQSEIRLSSYSDIPGVPLLPQFPSGFHESKGITPLAGYFPELTVTNRGLRVSPDFPIRVLSLPHEHPGQFLGICVGYIPRDNTDLEGKGVYLPLRKVAPGLFYRHSDLRLTITDSSTIERSGTQNTVVYYIVMYDIQRSLTSFTLHRKHSVFVPDTHDFDLVDAVPERLWDPEDRAFLRPSSQFQTFFPMVLALMFQERNADSNFVMVLCDNSTGIPAAGVVSERSANIVMRQLFRGRQREDSLIWADFETLGVDVRFERDASITRDEAGHSLFLRQSTLRPGFPPVRASLQGHSLDGAR
ncbi:hypothetical protein Q7P37_006131 [Cladosporium fusiforme]